MKNLIGKTLGLGLATLTLSAAFGAGALKETIASPRSLPSDVLPPFGMLDDAGKLVPVPDPSRLPASMLAAKPAEAAKPATGYRLSLDLAIEAVRASIDKCSKNGFSSAAAVVDAEGKPVAMLSEGTEGSVFVAMRKAATTLAFRMPTSGVGPAIQKNPALLAKMTPVMFISGGALPLMRGTELIGAIGSSGAHGAGPIGTQDEICAQAGLDKIKDRLR